MYILFLRFLIICLVLIGGGATSSFSESFPPLRLSEVRNFVCYFGGEKNLKRLSGFDLIIIDPDDYEAAEVRSLRAKGKIVIASLSLGEAENYRWFFSRVKQDWLRGENPNWPGHFYVDVNRNGWRRLLLDSVIPPIILEKGFDGLYLDTVDTASPYNFPEVRSGMVTLIKDIRRTFPGKFLIASNANFIIEDISSHIDALAVEDLFSYYDHEEKTYKKTPLAVRRPLIRELISIRRRYGLPVFTIDYAGPGDMTLRRYSYRSSSRYKFIPYVSTVELDRVFFEPSY